MTATAQVCVSAPDNLVSWYRAENNALDARGLNNGSTLNGANYATGQVGQAFNFDGVDDMAVIPDSPLYAFGTNSFTVEFWARADSSNNYNTMLTKRAEAVPFDGFNFYRDPNGILGADIKSGGTASLTSDSAMQLGQIYHLALVIDRTANSAKLYVNGILQNSQPSLSGVGSLTNSEPFRVGRVAGSAANPNPLQAFDGFIDELSIYNRALSTSEIQAIFNAGIAGKCPAVPVPNDLVSWYMGENSPLDARGGNHATPQNGANYANGQVGRAFNFDGIDDYYSAPSVPEINFGTSDFSVEYWIKINGSQLSAGREYGVVNKNATYQGTPGWGFELSTEFGNFPNPRIDFFNTISVWNSSNVRATITTDVWHHVVGLRENGVNKLYLDGVLAQTNANLNAAANVDNSQPLLIGSWLGTYFPGQLDEISLYKRALTESEIQAIFNAGSAGKLPTAATAPTGLVEWWTADNNALGARNRNNGILQNGASYASGKAGNAFNFDGADDVVQIGDNSTLDFGLGDFSVEAWIKWNGAQTNGGSSEYGVINKTASYAGSPGWGFEISTYGASGGNADIIFYNSGQGTWNNTNVQTPTPYPPDVWHHIVGIRQGSTLSFYVNGQLVHTKSNPEAAFSVNNSQPLVIGDHSWGPNFPGQVDELAVYDRALSASEIQNIFNAGSAGKSKPTATAAPPNQVLWLAGDGSTSDLTALNPIGILRGDTGYRVGKVGQSFNFDGTGDYVEIPDNTAQRPANDLTIEGWFKVGSLDNTPHFVSKPLVGSLYNSYVIWYEGQIRAGHGTPSNFETLFTGFTPNLDTWYHYAYTLDDAANVHKFFINGSEIASATSTLPLYYDANPNPLLIGAEYDSSSTPVSFLNGQEDEASLYNRALSADEIASIYNAGQAGKLKQTTTNGTSATVGDVSLTYPNSATRRTQIVPLDESDFPALPGGITSTGLLYDISTDVLPTGNTDICFNLPSFASLSSTEFDQRRVLHLENGEWMNRTLSRDFTNKIICARTPSLSPFAIVDSNIAPTAANISVSGRVNNKSGNGLANVRVSITDENGNVRNVSTNSFGYYRFDEIEAGQTYVLAVSSKRYQFDPPTQIIYASDDLSEINFTAIE